MAGITKNLFYSTLLTSAHYVFPLLVYPYVSRVLGVGNIGLVSFIDSIATYFILFSMMGISIVGVRETARARGDRARLGEAARSLLALNGLLTLACLVGMAAATILVPQLAQNWRMMLVGMSKLVFNLFLIEWIYRGLEDFRYVTLRSLAIRGLYVVGVFVFVRDAGDTLVYYVLTMLVVVVTAAVNMVRSRRLLSWTGPVSLRRYARPFFGFGMYTLLTTAYTTLNVAYLGFVTDATQVGYYATAMKLMSILISLYASFTAVMLPRMSSLAAEGEMERFGRYMRRSVVWMSLLTLPVIMAVEAYAPEVVWLLSGAGYEGAVVPIRVMMPFLLLVGLEQMLTMQALVPLGRDRAILSITAVAAVVGVALNIALVGRMGATGSAIVWAASETVLLLGASLALRSARIYGNIRQQC